MLILLCHSVLLSSVNTTHVVLTVIVFQLNPIYFYFNVLHRHQNGQLEVQGKEINKRQKVMITIKTLLHYVA